MTDLPPILSEHDILRLAKGLGVGASEFLQHFFLKGEEGDDGSSVTRLGGHLGPAPAPLD